MSEQNNNNRETLKKYLKIRTRSIKNNQKNNSENKTKNEDIIVLNNNVKDVKDEGKNNILNNNINSDRNISSDRVTIHRNIKHENFAEKLKTEVLNLQYKTPFLTRAKDSVVYYVKNAWFGILTAVGAATGAGVTYKVNEYLKNNIKEKQEDINDFIKKNSNLIQNLTNTIEDLKHQNETLYNDIKNTTEAIDDCKDKDQKSEQLQQKLLLLIEEKETINNMIYVYNQISNFNDELLRLQNILEDINMNADKFKPEDCDVILKQYEDLYNYYSNIYADVVGEFFNYAKKWGPSQLGLHASLQTENFIEDFEKSLNKLINNCAIFYDIYYQSNNIEYNKKQCENYLEKHKSCGVYDRLYKEELGNVCSSITQLGNKKDFKSMIINRKNLEKQELQDNIEFLRQVLNGEEPYMDCCVSLNIKTCYEYLEFIFSTVYNIGIENSDLDDNGYLIVNDRTKSIVENTINEFQNEIDKINNEIDYIEANITDLQSYCHDKEEIENQINDINKNKEEFKQNNIDKEKFNKILNMFNTTSDDIFNSFEKNKTNNILKGILNTNEEQINNINEEKNIYDNYTKDCNYTELYDNIQQLNNSINSNNDKILESESELSIIKNQKSETHNTHNNNNKNYASGITIGTSFGAGAGLFRGWLRRADVYCDFKNNTFNSIVIPIDNKGNMKFDETKNNKRDYILIENINNDNNIAMTLHINNPKEKYNNIENLIKTFNKKTLAEKGKYIHNFIETSKINNLKRCTIVCKCCKKKYENDQKSINLESNNNLEVSVKQGSNINVTL